MPKSCIGKAEAIPSEGKERSESNGEDNGKRPKVLWLMQYVPHYREGLMRALSEHCDLTVSATPCSDYMLLEPEERKGYRYYEGRGWELNFRELAITRKFGLFRWLPWEYGLVWRNRWDVVFCVEDMHYPLRYFMYLQWLFMGHRRPKWVWWGIFTGKKDWLVLKLIRRFLINSSDGALPYTEELQRRLIALGCKSEKVVSANNSEVSEGEIRPLPLAPIRTSLNILFVGRYLKHKRIERLINLAERLQFVRIRLIGPGLEKALAGSVEKCQLTSRVSICGPKIGEDLKEDFLWCHLVGSPGHLGLLVVSAAKHGRAIIGHTQKGHELEGLIGKKEGEPSPESLIAREAEQPFINWENDGDVDSFFRKAYAGELPLKDWGLKLAEYVRTHYTIEKSVERFISFF